MKSDKSLWGSISILIGVVIGILALAKGSLQVWLLLGVFHPLGALDSGISAHALYAAGKTPQSPQAAGTTASV